MAVLVDKNTRLIVQGITGKEGTFHAKGCAEYGTKVVGGVTPGKGGTTHEGWPVFDTVAEGRLRRPEPTPPSSSSRRPSRQTPSSKPNDAGLPLIICITEGIPINDMVKVWETSQVLEVASHRPKLPRRHLARQGQDRHHARPHS